MRVYFLALVVGAAYGTIVMALPLGVRSNDAKLPIECNICSQLKNGVQFRWYATIVGQGSEENE